MSEIYFLGQILKDITILDKHYLTTDLFTTEQNQRVFRAMKELQSSGVEPDLLTLRDNDSLITSKTLADLNETSSAANHAFYYKKLVTAEKRRKLKHMVNEITDGLSHEADPEKLIHNLNIRISELIRVSDVDKLRHINSLLVPYMEKIEERYKAKGEMPGLTTGFDTLDQFTLGLQKKQFILVGARPSDGKTALMINMAHAAAKNKHIVCVINLETYNDETLTRLFSQTSYINSMKIITGRLQGKEFVKLVDTGGILSGLDMYFYDTPNITIDQVISTARQAVNMYKCEAIYIDYLQIIKATQKFYSTVDRLSFISQALKELARELDVPVICMAQLNRDAARGVPTSAEFKGSGQLEQDADVSILIHHERDKEDFKQINKSFFIVDKNRNGETGGIPVRFATQFVKFTELTKGE